MLNHFESFFKAPLRGNSQNWLLKVFMLLQTLGGLDRKTTNFGLQLRFGFDEFIALEDGIAFLNLFLTNLSACLSTKQNLN